MSAVRVTLADPEGTMLQEIADPAMKREDVALTYAFGLRDDLDGVDWGKVNRAIVERWSVTGLKWIKTRAWKQVQS